MPTVSPHYKRSRISADKFEKLLGNFASDLSATEAAFQTGLTRKTVTSIFLKLRQRIARDRENKMALWTERHSEDGLCCRICVCGRCKLITPRTTPLFGVLTAEDRIFTFPMPDCRKPLLRALVRKWVSPADVTINGWHGYHALVDADFPTPLILNQEPSLPSSGAIIEDFWRFTLERLAKFNGISNRTFYFHLKESEWRFNLRTQDLQIELLSLLEEEPL